ncbi:amino acid ABC transporter ATP-binding protein [Hylemonella gracilis]|uniref:Phosphate ABC transporter ATP-binding protein n=1 Tax=Hylemonella gracilis ATCC 19624 TaxID=887062 RepID=F3KU58_9BURK|nr:amino acid ABC transporter ATP-binding protein [Hylemonella gracilis]EGI76608.1 phosphate ABC transporter ATP-binding protein [Hylemonella gracilis ATCC 19624]
MASMQAMRQAVRADTDSAQRPVLRIEGLRKSYGALDVLKGISLELHKGETLALIGPSGSGKSTCLRCINFLEHPTDGAIFLDEARIGQLPSRRHGWRWMSDRELAPQRAEIGMVFQGFYLWPHLNVRDNVALGPIRAGGMARAEAHALAQEMLDKVHLGHKADEFPERLSGGQQQRVAIARALAQRPRLILFDEPTSALDPELVGEVLGVIRELAEEGRSMILVTHEIRFARDVADRVIFMDQGHIVEQGSAAEVIDRPRVERTRSFLGKVGGSIGASDDASAQVGLVRRAG